MDVKENVNLNMKGNVEEALSKLIPMKSKERYLAQYKLFENWKNMILQKKLCSRFLMKGYVYFI